VKGFLLKKHLCEKQELMFFDMRNTGGVLENLDIYRNVLYLIFIINRYITAKTVKTKNVLNDLFH